MATFQKRPDAKFLEWSQLCFFSAKHFFCCNAFWFLVTHFCILVCPQQLFFTVRARLRSVHFFTVLEFERHTSKPLCPRFPLRGFCCCCCHSRRSPRERERETVASSPVEEGRPADLHQRAIQVKRVSETNRGWIFFGSRNEQSLNLILLDLVFADRSGQRYFFIINVSYLWTFHYRIKRWVE